MPKISTGAALDGQAETPAAALEAGANLFDWPKR